jgi:hypothetical protein
MRTLKIVLLHFIGLFVILCLHSLIFLKHYGSEYRHFYSEDNNEDEETSFEDTIPTIEYLQDSTYKVVTDTIISVYNVKTGEKISSLSKPYEPVKFMAMHPSGSHLLILDEYSVNVYDLIKDNLANQDTTTDYEEDTTTVWLDDLSSADVTDVDEIAFSTDGKYLFTIDYSETEVDLYKWPELSYITTEYMGIMRNSFWWENKHGKLVFFYHESKYTYRTEFPADSNADSLFFSEPVCIDSVRIKE